MQKVRGCTVTGWVILAENVVKISYENGAVLVVNSGENSFDDGTLKVSGQSYSFYEGGLQ